jgi:hypothetical protein
MHFQVLLEALATTPLETSALRSVKIGVSNLTLAVIKTQVRWHYFNSSLRNKVVPKV